MKIVVSFIIAVVGGFLFYNGGAIPISRNESSSLLTEGDSSRENTNSSKSRLVITHIIRTIEFDVGLLDNEGSGENDTETSTEEYIETDIKLLDPILLKNIIDHMTNISQSSPPSEDTSTTLKNDVDTIY